MRAALLRGAAFALAWWALADGGGLLFGAATVVAATAASLALLPPSGRRLRPLGVARFAGFFARESFRGGLDVGRRGLFPQPRRRTRGTYLVHRTRFESGVPRALLVGTIGLLPGTVAVDSRGAEVRVHVLDRELAEAALIESLEERIADALGEHAR